MDLKLNTSWKAEAYFLGWLCHPGGFLGVAGLNPPLALYVPVSSFPQWWIPAPHLECGCATLLCCQKKKLEIYS